MPLNDPVPSTAADVLERNVQDFDRFVVGNANTFVNRLGVEKLTIAGINDVALTGNPAVQAAQQAIDAKNEAQLYAEAAATNADWVYPNVAAGEAVRVDGEYFWVVSTNDSEVLELWLMGATTATDTGKRILSKSGAVSELNKILISEVRLQQLIEKHSIFKKASFLVDFCEQVFANTDSKTLISSKSIEDVITLERDSLAWCWGADGYLHEIQPNEFCFDHDPKTGEPRGVFKGEKRTNLIPYSDDLTHPSWDVATETTAQAVSNAGVHPDGTETACALVEGDDLNYHTRRVLVPVEEGKRYTVSFIAQRGVGNRNINWYSNNLTRFFGLSTSVQGVMFDLANGVVKNTDTDLDGDIFDLGKGRFWCIVYLPEAVLSDSDFAYTFALCRESDTSPRFPTYEGDGESSVIVSCCQFEEISDSNRMPSLPIRTNGAAYTREEDVIKADASWATNKDGTLFIDFASFTYSPDSPVIKYPSIAVIDDNLGAERIGVFYNCRTRAVYAQVVPGSEQQIIPEGDNLLLFNRVAVRFERLNKAISLNGSVSSFSDTSVVPQVFNLSVGSRVNGSGVFSGWYKSIAWINSPVSDDELSRLTADIPDDPVSPVDPVEPITHTVELMYSNLGATERDLEVIWWSNSSTDRTLMYRVRGSGAYHAVQSETVELMPSKSSTYIHRALIKNLSPDCEYDVRIKNSDYSDIFYTPPTSDLKVALAADWQNYNFSPSGRYATFGHRANDEGAHLYVMAGDYVNDDGRFEELHIDRWREMMSVIVNSWRRGDALMPGIYVMGNHEGRNANGTGNAYQYGNGTPGPIINLMSAGYYEGSGVTGDFRSTGCVVIGKELAIIMLETDHTVPLIDQLDWFQSKLAEVYPKVRHIMVVGHASPFIINHMYNVETPTQVGVLRNSFWPVMQQYADKIDFYFCGHEHCSSDSGPKQIDYDPNLTYEQNKSRWRTVSDSEGIRSLMIGPAGANNTTYPEDSRMLAESSLDGSTWVIMGFGHDNAENITNTFGPVTNMRNNHHCIGIAEFNSSGWKVRYIGEDGIQFYETEII